jgi:hypothetical protein
MVSGIPPVGITQNERFLSCDTFLLGVQYVLCFKNKIKREKHNSSILLTVVIKFV